MLSVAEDYARWAHELPAMKDYMALHISVLLRFVEEGRCRDERLEPKSRNIGFALSAARPPPEIADEYSVAWYRPDGLEQTWKDGVFHNGLGETDEPELFARVDRAVGISSPSRELVALAAIWHEAPRVEEIGVDVARHARGQGLGRAAVEEAVENIIAADNAPFYSCGASNIRSQRTALSSGFLPACSFAAVVRT